MDGSQQPGPGFSSHVLEQLREASMSVTSTTRGRGRGRGPSHTQPPYHHQGGAGQYRNDPRSSYPVNLQHRSYQVMDNPKDVNSFPPLGASRPPQNLPNAQQQRTTMPSQPHPTQYHSPSQQGHNIISPPRSIQEPRREFFTRGRGGPHRGRGHFHTSDGQRQPQIPGQVQTHANEFQRPAPIQRKLFHPDSQPHFNSVEEQRAFQRHIMDQSDFMNHLASQSLKNQITTEEQQAKENFRKELEVIAQKVVADACTENKILSPAHVQLKLYGSLGSGFGVAGSDMDLLLAFPRNEGLPDDIEIESRRMLEKALLDVGIGARLLTNTRVPILRVCQKPNAELLKNLREYRLKWEQGVNDNEPPPVDKGFGSLPILTEAQIATATDALANLDPSAHEVPLPASPPSEHAKLEYVGDCGIQCDINFSNYVALHNTRLLKTYGKCDPRVRQVGVFVKSWAKARDINTPYRGTLSSYGYILMVLHYLMNIVNPPVIPNLQDMAKQKDTWEERTDVELCEGFDVRFLQDMNEVLAIVQDMPRNHESVGSLLRGFFWYYADPRGFHWSQDIISIRSRSGRLLKKSKGWTEAKWSSENSNVRLRYLLAIEDPFELEHNVGRTVGHSGIVAIREEFRRAWAAIENIQFDNEARAWFWVNLEGKQIPGEQLMAVTENRGDLLRRDQDYHRQKARQMRLELEAKEKSLQEAAAKEVAGAEETRLNGMSELQLQSITQNTRPLADSSSHSLINNGALQEKTNQQTGSNERVTYKEDKEAIQRGQAANTETIDWSIPFNENEISINAEWAQPPANEVNADVHFVQWLQEPAQTHQGIYDENEKGEAMNFEVNNTKEDDRETLSDVKIPWDNRSMAGRWLLRRDKRICAGTWSGVTNKRHQRINEEFPYDPNMTMADLAEKNKLLRSLYLNSFNPRHQSDEKEISSNATQPSPTKKVESSPRTESEVSASTKPVQTMTSTQSSEPVRTEKASISTKSTISTKSSTSELPKAKKPNKSRRKKAKSCASIDHQSQPHQTSNEDVTTRKSTQIEGTQSKSKSPNPAATELLKLFKQPSPITQPIATNEPKPSSPIPQKPSPTLVPLTLYPHVAPTQRPRDEDPNIMPIPRNPNFQFDPRQLADLETIRRGGNGCARFNEEFEIEENYEFGGAGMMAWKSEVSRDWYLSERDKKSASEVVEVEREPKGDEEGLLGELPGVAFE